MSTVQNIGYSTTIVAVVCGECSIPFGLPSNLHAAAVQDGRSFWCPNGHRISYHESENKRLLREKDRLERLAEARKVAVQAARDQAEAAERRRRAAKGQLTKVKRRVAAGVCPCCNRTFQDLARHMAGQHPDFAPEPKQATDA